MNSATKIVIIFLVIIVLLSIIAYQIAKEIIINRLIKIAYEPIPLALYPKWILDWEGEEYVFPKDIYEKAYRSALLYAANEKL